MTASSHVARLDFAHFALFYGSEPEFLDVVVPFVLDGLASAEPVLVAVPESKLSLLRSALGDACRHVTLTDLTDVGRNPGRILGAESAFAARHEGRPVRIVGEPVWPGRTDDEYPACVQHEALVNAAFAGRDATVLCPYDARGLGADVLADARMTHPLLWKDGSGHRSAEYAPADALTRYNRPLPGNSIAVSCTIRSANDLRPARSVVSWYGKGLGLPAEAIANLELIATELATNSLEHAGGACRLALWQHNGYLVCEARDHGRINDPLAGRRPPVGGMAAGRGLFLVNALADLVRTHSGAGGTTIQACVRTGSAKRGIA